MSVRAVRQLLGLILVVVGIGAVAAGLWAALGGVSAHRAFSLGFVIWGAVVLVFGMLTVGAERRAYGMDTDTFLVRRMRVRPDERVALNPSGALAVAGLVCIGLSIVFGIVL